jgi:hypothetical protein
LDRILKFFDRFLEKEVEGRVGAFLSFDPANKSNILKRFFRHSTLSQRGLLAFADVGNGDLICFDYSVSGWDDPEPPVVYWHHEWPEPKDISDIAINFEAFLKMLKPCSDDAEDSDSSET